MPLPPPARPDRQPVHTRSVRFESFRRDDGRFDIEGTLDDVKPFDVELSSGRVPAGRSMHVMRIRLTIDEHLDILDACAVTDAMPYPPACGEVGPAYREALVGLNLGRGFRRAVLDRLGGVAGCTHMTELLLQFPTAAIQTLAGFKRDNEDRGEKPFQLDRCHALDTRGETVARFYPKWHARAQAG